LWLAYVATRDGSIFGVTHTPAAPKFELFLRTSSIRSSNFVLRIVRKTKTFWNVFDFCEIFRFSKKKRTFPEVPPNRHHILLVACERIDASNTDDDETCAINKFNRYLTAILHFSTVVP
jgi:hypothetical protein